MAPVICQPHNHGAHLNNVYRDVPKRDSCTLLQSEPVGFNGRKKSRIERKKYLQEKKKLVGLEDEKTKKEGEYPSLAYGGLRQFSERGMETTLCIGCSLPAVQARRQHLQSRRFNAVAARREGVPIGGGGKRVVDLLGRRCALLASGLSLVSAGLALGFPGDGLAVTQGLLAGRIPGLSEPDENGECSLF